MTTDRQETIAERQSRSFGEIIRRKRRELGLNQRDLALAAGTGERFIVDLEAGKPTSQLGKSLAVAKALGLDVAALLNRAGPEDKMSEGRRSEVSGYNLPNISLPLRRGRP